MDKKAKQDRNNARKKRDYKTYTVTLHKEKDKEQIAEIETRKKNGELTSNIIKDYLEKALFGGDNN